MRFFQHFLLSAFISSLLFFPFLGGVHLFDWDEINFAEIAREMIISGNYFNAQIDYQTFTEKPPLFMWLQALSMRIFGVNEFAARFPNALLGVVVSCFIVWYGYRKYSVRFGWIWLLLWWASILPHLYFKSGIIDPWFNFFIFLSLLLIISHYYAYRDHRKSFKKLIAAGIFSGLAILTKGPVALLVISLVALVYWIFKRFRWYLPFWHFLVYLFVSLATFGVWLLIDFAINGPDFLIEFTIRQWELLTTSDAGHRGFAGYHIVVLFFGCIPASAFFVSWLLDRKSTELSSWKFRDLDRWMMILFFVVLILFSLVKTKIVHYSSLAYYPLTFLAARYLHSRLKSGISVSLLPKFLYSIQWIVLLIISIAITIFHWMKDALIDKISDPFARENLQAEWVIWPWLDYWPMILALSLAFMAFHFFKSQKFSYFIQFSAAHILWIQLVLYAYVGNIERISQRANIEFFKSIQNERAYVATFNYKSYAHLFYSESKNLPNLNRLNPIWLRSGDIDLPVYFSVRKYHVEEFKNSVKDAEFLYHKNGFYFFVRYPK